MGQIAANWMLRDMQAEGGRERVACRSVGGSVVKSKSILPSFKFLKREKKAEKKRGEEED